MAAVNDSDDENMADDDFTISEDNMFFSEEDERNQKTHQPAQETTQDRRILQVFLPIR